MLPPLANLSDSRESKSLPLLWRIVTIIILVIFFIFRAMVFHNYHIQTMNIFLHGVDKQE